MLHLLIYLCSTTFCFVTRSFNGVAQMEILCGHALNEITAHLEREKRTENEHNFAAKNIIENSLIKKKQKLFVRAQNLFYFHQNTHTHTHLKENTQCAIFSEQNFQFE